MWEVWGEVWESVLECRGERGDVEKHEKVCWGVGKCGTWRKYGERCGGVWGEERGSVWG